MVVEKYLYAVFLCDATLSYVLLQVSQRLILAKNSEDFCRLLSFSKGFSMMNALIAIAIMATTSIASANIDGQTLTIICWLTFSGIFNYFSNIIFSISDYSFEYRSFAISSTISNILSLSITVVLFKMGFGILSLVFRDVSRSFIQFSLSLYAARRLVQKINAASALDRSARIAFFSFLMKRHVLKLLEVSNHRVPALIVQSRDSSAFAQFGVAFQLTSQIMGLLMVAADKIAYSLFSRNSESDKITYLWTTVGIYAVCGAAILSFGQPIFYNIYGPSWRQASYDFASLGFYIFSHGTLVIITNYLITRNRFMLSYLPWGVWTFVFITSCSLARQWNITNYYQIASGAALLAAVFCYARARHRPDRTTASSEYR